MLAHLIINSIWNKFDLLTVCLSRNVVIMISRAKIDVYESDKIQVCNEIPALQTYLDV